MYICIYVYMYIYIYTYMHIYIYIYTLLFVVGFLVILYLLGAIFVLVLDYVCFFFGGGVSFLASFCFFLGFLTLGAFLEAEGRQFFAFIFQFQFLMFQKSLNVVRKRSPDIPQGLPRSTDVFFPPNYLLFFDAALSAFLSYGPPVFFY